MLVMMFEIDGAGRNCCFGVEGVVLRAWLGADVGSSATSGELLFDLAAGRHGLMV